MSGAVDWQPLLEKTIIALVSPLGTAWFLGLLAVLLAAWGRQGRDFVRQLDDIHQIVRRMTIIPVEVIVRNIATGSLVKRLGIQEGLVLEFPLVEYCYKSDELGDPPITHDQAVLFGWATGEQLDKIKLIKTEIERTVNFDT